MSRVAKTQNKRLIKIGTPGNTQSARRTKKTSFSKNTASWDKIFGRKSEPGPTVVQFEMSYSHSVNISSLDLT